MSVARSFALVDVAAPRTRTLANVLLVVAASLLTAAAAQLEIRLPWTPVPITGQTFAVLLCGAVLGARRAFLAQCLYLFEGAAGLPFFSGGAAGLAHLVGPTGGYLMAFPLAAALTGLMSDRGWNRSPFTAALAMLTGSTVIFALGLVQLSLFIPRDQVLAAGLLPFIPGDLVKSAIAGGLFPLLWKAARRFGNDA
jgi:biotin transport system substrate-specific component